jgi:methyltransferase (TIGR00027 family)
VNAKPPLIRHISDTARWMAIYRARESERTDALFKDPFAKRLAGERGAEIGAALPGSDNGLWAFTTRTYIYDQLILQQIAQGADLVVNLAAGLDMRPYRMALPASLRWVEVDFGELIAYKEGMLGEATPVCSLTRIPLDLADVAGRRKLFEELGATAKKAVIVTEGMFGYLSEEEAGAFAVDLAREESFQTWMLDFYSPRVLKMFQWAWNSQLARAGAPLKFGPEGGSKFFEPYGWQGIESHSIFWTAARLKRLTGLARLFTFLPVSPEGTGNWAGICLMRRAFTGGL